MAFLDGFEMINAPEAPFITLSKYGITFSKLSLELLDYAQYVHGFLNRDMKQFAVKPCEKDDAAIEFVSATKSRLHKVGEP